MKNAKMLLVILAIFFNFIVAGAVLNYGYITHTPFYYGVGVIHILLVAFLAWKAYKEITKEG